MIKSRIKNRIDSFSNWAAADPVLLDGEIAVVKINGELIRLKAGNGVDAFSELPYLYGDYAASADVSAIIEEYGYTRTYINGIESDLSVVNLTEDEYHALSPEERAISNLMYVVAYENANMYGSRVVNVADPEQNSDAATKGYVDRRVSEVYVPTRTSELVNDSGFLSSHQSLSGYYTKTQVDEISGNLAGRPAARLSVPESGIQQDLSVLNIVKVTRQKYRQMEEDGNVLSDRLYIVEAEDDGIIFGGNSFTC